MAKKVTLSEEQLTKVIKNILEQELADDETLAMVDDLELNTDVEDDDNLEVTNFYSDINIKSKSAADISAHRHFHKVKHGEESSLVVPKGRDPFDEGPDAPALMLNPNAFKIFDLFETQLRTIHKKHFDMSNREF